MTLVYIGVIHVTCVVGQYNGMCCPVWDGTYKRSLVAN